MTVFVNYYTCSYGDSLVNMFNGERVSRTNGIAKNRINTFVEPIFYTKSTTEQIEHWTKLQSLDVKAVPCHRQYQFDFRQTFNNSVSVITVVLDDYQFLPSRFKTIHLDSRNKQILNKMLIQLISRYPEKYREIILADYKSWIDKNCLSSDIKFYFSWINDAKKVEEFCNQYQLSFDADWLKNILQDKQNYVV